jgi:hypothetical protein
MTKYCTLAKAKTEGDITGTSRTLDDNYILAAVEAVSRRIDGLLQPTQKLSKRPYFAPYLEDRAMSYYDNQINSLSGVLDINQWFLELNTVTAGTIVITTSVDPFIDNFPPYKQLQLTVASGKSWYSVACGDSDTRPYLKPLTINAIWGWHHDWANAWIATSTLLAAIVSTTATTFTVQAGEGALFSPGHFLQIDSEYMEIVSISTDTLTVTRGANGSTAATHLINAPVSILEITEDVQRITARQAASMYARRGAFEAQLFSDTGGVITYPEDLLQELTNTLLVYQG